MTIFALSTGIGASGVAIIRISGPETGLLIKKLTKNKHYNFLETLAEDVFDELFKDKRIDKISLQIEKLEIMKDCASVGIQISKKRSHEKP